MITTYIEKLRDMEKVTLFLILLVFCSLIISSTSIPPTRIQRTLHEGGERLIEDFKQEERMEEAAVDDVINARMDLESNDYQGSGANDRHTPKPPDLRKSRDRNKIEKFNPLGGNLVGHLEGTKQHVL
ncbi:uncharacterized protein LOC109711928 isoform X2 [Ananas comosus]|uniref:Uncharacterized protein LOC109711928 isoform X2 n=1 Tax=Ananas comosus TaxID=4615 RepID=A0A6P5FBR0_ANACO|nr:uncharacterized protein LOC109711928 isoform X2 [Ananas comosus]